MQHAPMAPRTAHVRRETRESRIEVALNLDGSGRGDIATGIGFLDHMLDSLARHARFDLTVRSEEHTSELQSHSDLVCRLLLEKKKPKPARRALLTSMRPHKITIHLYIIYLTL